MNSALWTSLGLILLGGILQGTFAVPMKRARQWRHENIWLLFASTGLVIFPWLWAAVTVPHLADVYASAPASSVVSVVAFGLGWGIGATLTGIGINLLGIGLGLGLILGICASAGSLVPYLALEHGQLFNQRGLRYLAGTGIMFAGIALVTVAGIAREKEFSKGQSAPRRSIWVGLAVCVGSGLLSSMLNFAFAFGGGLLQTAAQLGTPAQWTSNVVIAPATTGGFVANLVYCVYQFRKHNSWSLFQKPHTGGHWIAGALTGAFWFGGLALYGVGQLGMGRYGVVLGWPIMMGSVIVASNIAGLLTGEWDGTGQRTRGFLAAGCAVILAALAVLARAQPGS